MVKYSKEDLMAVIPHRDPMLLVEETEYEEEAATAVSKYTIKEDAIFVQGHFPGNPIVPGVILCEIMAQGSAIVAKPYLEGKLALYAGLNNVKFKGTVRPGDTVVTTGTLTTVHLPLIIVTANAKVDGKLVCKAEMSFLLVDRPNE